MKLNNLKQPWRYFKAINSLEAISTEDILSILNSVEATNYQVRSLSFLPNSVVFGLILMFCQSC